MRYVYTILFYLSLPFVFLRLWWRSRSNPAYLARWWERLGYFPQPFLQKALWIHAVSVGETIAAAPLIKELRKRYPNLPIVVTSTTPNGADRVRALLGDQVRHSYMPYDVPNILKRFLQRIDPIALVLIETELWPNLLHVCSQQQVPVVLINARLSDRSAKAYQRYAAVTRPMFKQISKIAAQTKQDAANFIASGALAETIEITGSVKFDLQLPTELAEQAKNWRARWGEQRPVWIAASTHAGEESQILQAYAKARQDHSDLLLILTPRHPERAEDVANLSVSKGYKVVRRSAAAENLQETDILLVDTIGELLLFYSAADIAFVGGSLITPGGGHNLLEPAAVGIPVLSGPALFNFVEISQLLTQAGAAFIVKNVDELAAKISFLLQNKAACLQAGAAGRQVLQNNCGAMAKQLALIEAILPASFK